MVVHQSNTLLLEASNSSCMNALIHYVNGQLSDSYHMYSVQMFITFLQVPTYTWTAHFATWLRMFFDAYSKRLKLTFSCTFIRRLQFRHK